MEKGRLEAFSDGVIAIIITIMVLELKVPHGTDWEALRPLAPVFFCYMVSFLYVGIYWNNHHHLIKTCRRVTSGIMWANLHLLFWLSLFPFVTGWMGETYFALLPTVLYGVVLFLAAVAYYILQNLIIADHGPNSRVAESFGRDFKGRISLVLYLAGIALAFWKPWLGGALYVTVALMWLMPDRRLAKVLE